MKAFVIRCAVIVVVSCAVSAAVFGEVPRILTVQGKLTNSLGQAVPDGLQSVTFRLYDVETCGQGTALWQEAQNVQTNGGIFNVNLGAVTPITVPFDEQYWLGIQPPSCSELCPRTRLTTAPYTVRAEIADSVAPGGLSPYVGNIQNLAGTSANPEVVGWVATEQAPWSVAVSGRYAYVANYDSHKLQVIDVSDPERPAVVGSVATSEYPWSVAVSGRYAYVTNNSLTANKLEVIDISNPASPTVVGSVTCGRRPRAVTISGRYAYVAAHYYVDNALQVIDVSDPASPVMVGSVATCEQPYSVAVSGRYAYVTNCCTHPSKLQAIDVSNPASPAVVGEVETGEYPSSVAVSGRYAYVTLLSKKLQVIDVSSPAGPAVIGEVPTAGEATWVAVSGRYAYVTNWDCDTVQVIDVLSPASPVVVGSVGTGDSPHCVVVSGRYAYVTNMDSDTLQVIDVTGIETTALNAHSVEAGTLQVRGSAVVANQLSVGGGLNVGPGGIFSDGSAAFNGIVQSAQGGLKFPDGTIQTTAAAAWRHCGVQVFSGTSEPTWTPLDLSEHVGQNNALVLLKVKITGSDLTDISFRPAGDADEYHKNSDTRDYAANGCNMQANAAALILAETAVDGRLEFRSGASRPGTTIVLMGYVR